MPGPNRTSRCGQAVVEFSIILVFFLGVLFIVFTLIMMMIAGQTTFYSTFMSARAASVSGDTQAAGESIMPRFTAVETTDGENVTVKGSHEMMPFLSSSLTLESNVTLHRWPNCIGTGDNPIPCP